MTLAALLPRIAGGAFNAELWNGLVGLAGANLPIPGGSVLTFKLSSPPAPDAWLASLQLTGGGTAFVHLREFPFRQMFNIGLDAADIATLPDGLRQAMLDGMFAAVFTALPQPVREAASMSTQGLASAFGDHTNGRLQWFDALLARPDGGSVGFSFGCDRADLLRLLGDSLAGRASADGPLAQHLALPAYPTVGRLSLSYEEFAGLEPGAVVVLPLRADGRLAVRVDDVLYEFSQVDNGWTCLGGHPAPIEWAEGARMDDAKDPAAAPEGDAGTISVSGLKIALDFDIARLSVPIGTLSQWQPGSVVSLDVPVTESGLAVTIRANGEVVGHGDLVQIDDRVAVRITRLLPRA